MTEDHLERALSLVRITGRYEKWPASGVLTSPYGVNGGREAEFVDHGLAFAVAEILNAINDGRLVRPTPSASREVTAP